jgi:putative transposase
LRRRELTFHSDRGSQYASEDSRQVLENHAPQSSMSGESNCCDNAVTEKQFGRLKVRRLHGERFQTIRQAKDAVLVWQLWYSRQRVRPAPNYLTPAKYESRWENLVSQAAAKGGDG